MAVVLCGRRIARCHLVLGSLARLQWNYGFANWQVPQQRSLHQIQGNVTQQTVDQLMKNYTRCMKDCDDPLPCLSDLLTQAQETDVLQALSLDLNFHDALRVIVSKVPSLPTTTLVSLLSLCHSRGLHSCTLIKPVATALWKVIPGLSIDVTSKIARYLSQMNCENLAELFLTHSTSQSETGVTDENVVGTNVLSNHLYAPHYNNLSPDFAEEFEVQEYIATHGSKMELQSLNKILYAMIKKDRLSTPLLRTIADTATKILSANVPVFERETKWGPSYPHSLSTMLDLFTRHQVYHEELFDAIGQVVKGSEDTAFRTPRFLGSLARSCAILQYYDPVLMDHVILHAMSQLHKFTNKDLGSLVYGLAQLNHPCPELLDKVVDLMLEDVSKLGDMRLCWTIVWSGMVMDVYPKRLLEIILTDTHLKYSQDTIDFRLILLLPLSVAMNVEHPELGFGSNAQNFVVPKKWRTCVAGLRGISDRYIREAVAERIVFHSKSIHSTFSSNVTRALKVVVGGSYYFNEEPLSLSGYSMDLEVMLNSKNKPIAVPIQWKYRQSGSLLKSIGIGDAPYKSRVNTSSLMGELRDVEDGLVKDGVGDDEYSPQNQLSLPQNQLYRKTTLCQLASDWGPRFSDTSEPVARRIAIEADGEFHFARNCPHVMGKTLLKHRQLKALGWEVVSISQYEWKSLGTGDDHIRYLARRLGINL